MTDTVIEAAAARIEDAAKQSASRVSGALDELTKAIKAADRSSSRLTRWLFWATMAGWALLAFEVLKFVYGLLCGIRSSS